MSAQRAAAEVIAELTRINNGPRITEPTREGFDAVLHGRTAALNLAYEMVADIGGYAGTKNTSWFQLAKAHPASALASTLRSYPRPEALGSPTDILGASAADSLTRSWERVGATATAGLMQWNGQRGKLPEESAESALSDAAAIGLAVAQVDIRLRAAAGRAGAHDISEQLSTRNIGHLRFTATSLLYETRDARASWDARLTPNLDKLPVLPVSHGRALPGALVRLNDQIAAGENLSPQDATLLVGAQARMSTLLADQSERGWRQTGDQRLNHLAAAMRGHATNLANTVGLDDTRLRGLMPTDGRPVQQAGECQRFMASVRQARWPAAAHLANLIVATGPTLSDAVDRQVRHGNWATLAPLESHRPGEPAWAVCGQGHWPGLASRLKELPTPQPTWAAVSTTTPPAATVTRAHARL